MADAKDTPPPTKRLRLVPTQRLEEQALALEKELEYKTSKLAHLKQQIAHIKDTNYANKVYHKLQTFLASKRAKKACFMVPAGYDWFEGNLTDLLATKFDRQTSKVDSDCLEMSSRRGKDQDVHDIRIEDRYKGLSWADQTNCQEFIKHYCPDLSAYDVDFLFLLDQAHWNEWLEPPKDTSLDCITSGYFAQAFVIEWIKETHTKYYNSLDICMPFKADIYLEK